MVNIFIKRFFAKSFFFLLRKATFHLSLCDLPAKVILFFGICKDFYVFLQFLIKKGVGKKCVGCSETVQRESNEVCMKNLRLYLSVSGMNKYRK